ncbi:DUF424 family protein [Candidatus Micrarchaeota archaeon]|nr:DUF424 family protein [Candidatus Micrarchaeota archaeon]
MLACCDKELLGKRLKEGKYDVTVERDFYGGELSTPEKLRELLSEAESANIFGERAVKVAIEEGLISAGNIIRIGGVPHVQIFRI